MPNGSGVVLSHAGKQHAYRTALALQQAGALRAFLTSSYYKRSAYPDRLATFVPSLDAWLQRRHQPGLDAAHVTRFPGLEWPEVAYRLVRGNDRNTTRLVRARDRRFDSAVSRLVASLGGKVFWGFQGSCAQSLLAARAAGMTTIAEFASIPSSVARRLMGDDAGIDERLDADIYLAASTFTADCLVKEGISRDKIRVIPLGVDVDRFGQSARKTDGPLRVLFVGKLARHKGVSSLLDAMRSLRSESVTLSLAGPNVGDVHAAGAADNVRFLGSIHGDELIRALHEHNVLVLPSLYEGFGFVIVEAMASGMPVIATRNSCAPDVIREGLDGFMIPPADSAAIAEKLEWCASHRAALGEMGHSASARARDFSWDRYADRVGDFVKTVTAS